MVVLNNLDLATVYYYKIVSANSSVEPLLSPRIPGDKTPFNMNVVLDLGVYSKDRFIASRRDVIPYV
jgi:acid phosphatase